MLPLSLLPVDLVSTGRWSSQSAFCLYFSTLRLARKSKSSWSQENSFHRWKIFLERSFPCRVGLFIQKTLGGISQWLLFPSPCQIQEGMFLALLCDNLGWGSPNKNEVLPKTAALWVSHSQGSPLSASNNLLKFSFKSEKLAQPRGA